MSASIYPSKPWAWSSDISNSNFLRSSYINGNLDISGQTICRTDASMCGNLAVTGSVSIGNSISINNSISVSNNIGMSGIINQMSAVPLSGGFIYVQILSADANKAISQVATLNTLLVSGTTPTYGGSYVVLGNTVTNTVLAGPTNYITGNIIGQYETNLNGNLTVGGNSNLNSNVIIAGNLTTGYDAFINNMIVGSGKSDVVTNTLIGGGSALQSTNTSGTQNTAIGYGTLNNIVSGYQNTAIGYNAGSLTSGTNQSSYGITFLGTSTGTNSVGSVYSYSTAVGFGATITDSNQVVLGRNTEKTVVSGDASLNGNCLCNGNLVLAGTANITGTMLASNIKQFVS
jgi:NDP-sugar pyrophosphorylase family protein